MKYIQLIFIRLIQFFFIVFPLILAGILILGLYILVKGTKFTQLPKYIKWFDNYEGDINGVNNIFEKGPKKDSRRRRFYWLALRNPLNYFQYKVLGKYIIKDSIGWEYRRVFINTEKRVKAILVILSALDHKNKVVREIYIKVNWPFINKHLRIRVGHKLQYNVGYLRQWVFSITPFRKST